MSQEKDHHCLLRVELGEIVILVAYADDATEFLASGHD